MALGFWQKNKPTPPADCSLRRAKHTSDFPEIPFILRTPSLSLSSRRCERHTDRLQPGVRENMDGFLPVIGTKTLISVAYTPVTKVKGGSRDSGRMDCRTENRDNLRKANSGYANVAFRIVREDKPAAKQC